MSVLQQEENRRKERESKHTTTLEYETCCCARRGNISVRGIEQWEQQQQNHQSRTGCQVVFSNPKYAFDSFIYKTDIVMKNILGSPRLTNIPVVVFVAPLLRPGIFFLCVCAFFLFAVIFCRRAEKVSYAGDHASHISNFGSLM